MKFYVVFLRLLFLLLACFQIFFNPILFFMFFEPTKLKLMEKNLCYFASKC